MRGLDVLGEVGGCGECRACAIPCVCRFLFNYLWHLGFRLLGGLAGSFSHVVDWNESGGSCVWHSWVVSHLILIDSAWTCCDM